MQVAGAGAVGGDLQHPRQRRYDKTSRLAKMMIVDLDNGYMVGTMRASEAAVSTAGNVVHRLETDSSRGLTSEEVEKRRKYHGFNEFDIREDEPLWLKYLNQV